MKLEAFYSLSDLVNLVEKDLVNKGFTLVGEPDSNGHKDFVLSLAVEQLAQFTAGGPASPTPAEQEKPAPKKELSPKRQEVLARARAKYAEKKKAEKIAGRKPGEPAAGPPKANPLLEKQAIRDQFVQQRLTREPKQVQEVVAPTSNPFPVTEMLMTLSQSN